MYMNHRRIASNKVNIKSRENSRPTSNINSFDKLQKYLIENKDDAAFLKTERGKNKNYLSLQIINSAQTELNSGDEKPNKFG